MRRILGAILAGLLLAAGSPAAGGESETAAVAASDEWLAIVDAGKYGESWDAAAALFRQALTRPQWEAAVAKVRAPLGTVVTRKLVSSELTTKLPGAPPGEYVVIQYDDELRERKGHDRDGHADEGPRRDLEGLGLLHQVRPSATAPQHQGRGGKWSGTPKPPPGKSPRARPARRYWIAARIASSSPFPSARLAAIAEDSVQPVP